jgi:predicted metalloprotease with PDZ domain
MKRNWSVISAPVLLFLGTAMCPGAGMAQDADNELRWQQEMARREIEDRARAQADALRGQEEAIRRMEATRARIEANAPQTFQPPAEQVRIYTYPVYTPSTSPDPVSGMSLAPLSEQLGTYFGIKAGVLVVRAGANSPYGLQDGDVILSIDGRVPKDEQHALDMLRSYRPGERVKLKLQRNRRAIELDMAAPGQRSN